MSISTPRVRPVPGGPVRVATAVLAAVLALVLAGTTEAASPDTTKEATASQDTTKNGKIPKKHVRELKRVVATKWAHLFADEACNRYMGQDLCARLLHCKGKSGQHVVIENCTPVSVAFQKTFADATVEDIALPRSGQCPSRCPGSGAAVKFSNGVVVVFSYDNSGSVQGGWVIGLPNHSFVRAATG
jgi:hypothetical protein